MIWNLDNYKDLEHYGDWINSWMLECMSRGEHQLTRGNYLDHIAALRDFYSSYDYDALFTN